LECCTFNEEEFAEEVVDALGAFADANKWLVSRTFFSIKEREETNIGIARTIEFLRDYHV
jgi:hypothetical protein